jgi:hypothetical protein
MSRLEVADLVVIAARTLELEPAAALDLLDVEAAEAALAEARRWCDRDPVEVGAAALLVGLVRHRPLARGNQQIALLATLQFLALHGWDLDLGPPASWSRGWPPGRSARRRSRPGWRRGCAPTPRRTACCNGSPAAGAPVWTSRHQKDHSSGSPIGPAKR